MDKIEKFKVIKLMRDKVDKDFGKGSIMTLSEKPDFDSENIVSTGSLSLDIALGVGGISKGKITEIYGLESSGKTTIAIHVIAEAQKNGGICAFIDAEHAFDKEYARNLGVDVDNLLISQPDWGEQALEIVDRMIDTGAFDVIVIDSVAALVPKGELDGEMGDAKMGLQARMMGQAMRKLAGKVHKKNVALIFINQIREKIGVMFGSPETTTGGNALKFYASVRLDVRRQIGKDVMGKDENDEFISHPVKVKVVKNKIAPPFKQADFNIVFGEGIDKISEIIDAGVELGIINKSGSWFSYDTTKIGQGKASVKQLFIDNEQLKEEIYKKIIDNLQKIT